MLEQKAQHGMFIKDLCPCEEFLAGDTSILRELLHPDKEDLALQYRLAHAVLPVGRSSQPHRLKTSEVYYVIDGNGRMHIDDATELVKPGQAMYILRTQSSTSRTSAQPD